MDDAVRLRDTTPFVSLETTHSIRFSSAARELFRTRTHLQFARVDYGTRIKITPTNEDSENTVPFNANTQRIRRSSVVRLFHTLSFVRHTRYPLKDMGDGSYIVDPDVTVERPWWYEDQTVARADMPYTGRRG